MPDFSKIWATNSPLTPYTFSDADYLDGWNFIGSAPPTKNQFDAWFQATDEKLNWLYNQLQNTASQIYPVGSVYISFASTSPATLFGGTWVRLKDTFLLANGDSYAADTTGGSPTKTIAVNNLPAHNHTVNSAGSHTHTATTASAGSHNHTASAASNGKHTHTATAASAGAHTHAPGTMNIKGTFSGVGNVGTSTAGTLTGAFYRVNASVNPSQGVTLDNSGERDDYFGFDASRNWTGATASAGSHTHTITVSETGAHTHSITVNSNGSHSHTVTVNSNGAHTHTTNNTGGNAPLNIMPPYTTVYMWRRTA